jgi:hypothetical protein
MTWGIETDEGVREDIVDRMTGLGEGDGISRGVDTDGVTVATGLTDSCCKEGVGIDGDFRGTSIGVPRSCTVGGSLKLTRREPPLELRVGVACWF